MAINTPVITKKIIAGNYILPAPSDIDTSEHFWKAFGKIEAEISARYIVRFFKERDDKDWSCGFTEHDMDTMYEKAGHGHSFNDNGIYANYCVRRNGRYYVTEEFVRRCAGEIKT